ncbi:S1 RNA-binding domain-containing protein [Desulfoluna sp.]|uniref:S1 RNA-binding domain-containing protein n=1 Tax=Desulfoluna sp. TaxID=2045199 RepID=UPI00261DA8FD|nr:S1 RNA-binding domain-containing protein [Desulfoluna sp.]
MNTKDPWAVIANRYPEGARLEGRVTGLVEYGCSVELEEGVEGFLHVCDMHWGTRSIHPSKIVNVGDLIDVMVLRLSEEGRRIFLGLKQCQDNPWRAIASRYPEGSRVEGRVTRIVDYGVFVEVEEGFDGLVLVSDLHWTDRNMHPSKMVNVGDLVEVMVLDICVERGRLSLGLKQCRDNPWELFARTYKPKDRVSGKIQSITHIGIFIELEGGVVGLAFLSDIPCGDQGEDVLRDFREGEEIDAVVLHVDAERERVNLGVFCLAQ